MGKASVKSEWEQAIAQWVESSDIDRAIVLPASYPKWAEPLLEPARFKGAWGGRAGGKSHFFAEYIVRQCLEDPDLRVACIREIQKSLKFSVKTLIESKIRELGVSEHFEILTTEIRRKGGSGIIIFQGMADHTADSIKSLEGFGIAWVEEAQRLSARSLQLLVPTIRKEGSSLLFSWNPDQPEDPVDALFRGDNPPKNSILVEVSYKDNPFSTSVTMEDAERDRARDTDTYNHVWLGGYNVKSDLQVFCGKWAIDEFEPNPETWDGPYFGGDWGFGVDPTAAVKAWIYNRRLYIERESYHYNLEIDDTSMQWDMDIPGICDHVVRVDSARPDSISHLRRGRAPSLTDRGCLPIPQIIGVDKWQGSVEEGIIYLQNFDKIIIHERCKNMQQEARLYHWRTNNAGDPIGGNPRDKYNHLWDSVRYAFAPLIRGQNTEGASSSLGMTKRRDVNARFRR